VALSVYIHFPFCIRKCPYCDFSSIAVERSRIPQREYTDAVLAELEWRAANWTSQQLVSIYIGGGTPSLWEPDQLLRVLNAIDARFGCNRRRLEVTLECNPSSLDRARAEAYRGIGINRLSIGVQSLDQQHLRYLNRIHDSRTGLKAVEDALSVVSRVGVDIMYGLADQSSKTITRELQRVVDLGIEHISAYALTVEPNTPFGDLYQRGKLSVAPEDEVGESFLEIRRTLQGLGFVHYEVSNYAVPGQESQHNQHYWRGNAYLGLGAAAVGCLHTALGSARRYRNRVDVDGYLATSGGPTVEEFTEELGPKSVTNELLMLGLRTKQGVHLPTVQSRTGITLFDRQDRDWCRLLQHGNLVREGDWLKVPKERWLLLDSIVASAFII
jgi:oxygen-independent coproporphyrinogen-3 oxidase